MGRKRYSEEVRLACLAALLAGQTSSEVAAEYAVPEATVRSWKARAGIGVCGENAPLVAQDDRSRMGRELLRYLERLLRAVIDQLEVMGDEVWLRKQSAAEVATLHGVCVDKALRIFAALEADDDAGDVIEVVPVVSGALSAGTSSGI